MMLKRGHWLLLLVLITLQGCRVYRDVEFKGVNETRFTSFNTKGVSCEFDVEIYNPNPYKISLIKSDVELFLEGTRLGRVELPSSAILDADDKTILRLSCTADPSAIRKLLSGAIGMVFKKELIIEGKGNVTAKAFLITKTVPVVFKQKLNKEDLGF